MSDNKLFYYILLVIFSCSSRSLQAQRQVDNIPLPSVTCQRLPVEPGSFATWLRHLPLKEPDVPVLNYRGQVFKTATDSIVGSVVDMDVSGRRLEQCMDIIVRFYAEYLWESNKTAGLNLPLPGGYRLNWETWKKGFRPFFKGLEITLKKSVKSDSSKGSYNRYLNTVFAESHTQQYYHAYKPVPREQVAIGDFIVKKGTKGHAVLIVDLAKNEHGDLFALIGNGDTPACQFFLINYKSQQPWVPLCFDKENLELPLRRKLTWDGLRRFDLIDRRE